MTITKLEHVGVMVHDMDASIRFYRDTLRMVLLSEIIEPDVPMHLAFMGFPDAPETVIELIQERSEPLPEVGLVHHIAFTVDDLDAEVSRLRGLGVHFIDHAAKTLPTGARYIFFYGPSKEHLELFQPAKPSER